MLLIITKLSHFLLSVIIMSHPKYNIVIMNIQTGKKKTTCSKWKNLPGLPVQYYIEGAYFEIRGKIPGNMNLKDFLQKITGKFTSVERNHAEMQKKLQKNKSCQMDLFHRQFNGELLKNVPVLTGQNKSIKSAGLLKKSDIKKHHETMIFPVKTGS